MSVSKRRCWSSRPGPCPDRRHGASSQPRPPAARRRRPPSPPSAACPSRRRGRTALAWPVYPRADVCISSCSGPAYGSTKRCPRLCPALPRARAFCTAEHMSRTDAGEGVDVRVRAVLGVRCAVVVVVVVELVVVAVDCVRIRPLGPRVPGSRRCRIGKST